MMKDMHLQYDDAPHPNHQDYGGSGYHGGQNYSSGLGGRGTHKKGN